MKKFPYTSPELAFMVLVMALLLTVGFHWRAETFWEFVARAGVGMVVGFCIWLSLVFLACRHYDRKKRDEKTQAPKSLQATPGSASGSAVAVHA